jgi:hypothetical protein
MFLRRCRTARTRCSLTPAQTELLHLRWLFRKVHCSRSGGLCCGAHLLIAPAVMLQQSQSSCRCICGGLVAQSVQMHAGVQLACFIKAVSTLRCFFVMLSFWACA